LNIIFKNNNNKKPGVENAISAEGWFFHEGVHDQETSRRRLPPLGQFAEVKLEERDALFQEHAFAQMTLGVQLVHFCSRSLLFANSTGSQRSDTFAGAGACGK